MAIVLSTGRALSSSSNISQTWERPSDWLDMPNLVQGDSKITMLVEIYEANSNYLVLRFTGDYSVNWGDGTADTNHTSNTNGEHEFLWANAPSSSVNSYGNRQVIVTITPQVGSTLTGMVRPLSPYYASGDGGYRYGTSNVKSLKIASTTITLLSSACYQWRGLEEFEYVGTNIVTDYTNTFTTCTMLKKIIALDCSSGTNFSSCFSSCGALIDIPALDTSNATVLTSMFATCISLKYIEPLDLSSCTNITSAFSNCKVLENFPCKNMNLVTNIQQAFTSTAIKRVDIAIPNLANAYTSFDGCSKLEILNLTTNAGTLTNTGYMFRSCKSLKYIKPFDTSNVTSFRNMFQSITTMKDFNWIDVSSAVDTQYMFEGCSSLEDASFLNFTTSLTTITGMFQICSNLKKLPSTIDCTNITSLQNLFNSCVSLVDFPTLTNTSSITSIYATWKSCYNLRVAPPLSGALITTREAFANATSLISIPNYDMSSITAYPNSYLMAVNAYNLRESLVTGAKSQHSYANCQLSRAAIVLIFNNLATNADGRSINVTKTPGSTQLTASDLLIATNKGWTVSS